MAGFNRKKGGGKGNERKEHIKQGHLSLGAGNDRGLIRHITPLVLIDHVGFSLHTILLYTITIYIIHCTTNVAYFIVEPSLHKGMKSTWPWYTSLLICC